MKQKLLATLLLGVSAAALSAQCSPHWVGTWASAQQNTDKGIELPGDLTHAVLRQVVHVSLGGNTIRLRMSNDYGQQPLHLQAVYVATPDPQHPGDILPATQRQVAFNGYQDVILPAGAEFVSDPISFALPAHGDLAITLQYGNAPVGQTTHSGSRSTSWLSHESKPNDAHLTATTTVEHWYQIAAVDVLTDTPTTALIAFGDSITDGHASTTNGNDRWTDVLANQIHAGVLNEGIGGNRLLDNGIATNGVARFPRDVLAQTGADTVIFLEGVNDLGTATRLHPISPAEHELLVARLESAFRQMAIRAHDAHLRILGGTITPYTGSDYYHPDAAAEHDRTVINDWVRHSPLLDGVVDFSAVVADPADPTRLKPAFDSGDHLHPSPAGYAVMGAAAAQELHRLKLFQNQTCSR